MNRANLMRVIKVSALIFLAVGTILAADLMTREQPVHALPEFAERTGEACGACHVNPGGGGPRTMAGLLWSAQGRPDEMPALTIPAAPGVTDGQEVYDFICAGCHGLSGEGLFGPAIVGSGWRDRKIETAILRGRERSGMPPFEGQLSDEQLAALVEYTAGLASGQIDPPPASYPLPAGELSCEPDPSASTRCGGN